MIPALVGCALAKACCAVTSLLVELLNATNGNFKQCLNKSGLNTLYRKAQNNYGIKLRYLGTLKKQSTIAFMTFQSNNIRCAKFKYERNIVLFWTQRNLYSSFLVNYLLIVIGN